jgi:hypothetical protein
MFKQNGKIPFCFYDFAGLFGLTLFRKSIH